MKNKQKVLTFTIIVLATEGDTLAIEQVLHHFELYINKLSQTIFLDEFGNSYIYIEDDIKRVLEAKLVMAILNFKLAI